MRYSKSNLNKKYIIMYDIVKNFHQQVKSSGWGKGWLPSKYTEELCKTVFNLSNRKDKSHDAIDSNGYKIEIKATIGRSSATTINTTLGFDKLYWLRFDFNKDIVHVKIYDKLKVENYLKSRNRLTGKRESITLNKVVNNKSDDHVIDFK